MAGPVIPLALNDVVEATVVCRFDEQIALNVLGYKATAIVGVGVALDAFVTQLDAAIAAAYKDLMCNVAEYYGVMARVVAPVKTIYVSTKVTQGDGVAGADPLPRQCCGMFTKLTSHAGPSGRGRMYVPFPAQLDCDIDTNPTVGYMVRLGTLAGILASPQAVVVGADSMTLSPCLLNPPAYAAPFLWQFATARQKFATHRSRGSYGRANAVPF